VLSNVQTCQGGFEGVGRIWEGGRSTRLVAVTAHVKTMNVISFDQPYFSGTHFDRISLCASLFSSTRSLGSKVHTVALLSCRY